MEKLQVKKWLWTFPRWKSDNSCRHYTHVPTSDYRILNNGTAYQTDLGMCGDYDSVIGMNKENSIKKFKKESDAISHYPAIGEGSLSGVIVEADEKTGLAKSINQIIFGGKLNQNF